MTDTTIGRILPRNANEFIEQELDERIRKIELRYTADAISFAGPLVFGVDDIIRTAVEKKHSERPRRSKLIVLLTTTGGYIEVVHRIVDTLRGHYKLVDFIVPNYAYSAGTVLVMSGDAIHMDYYSRLGPIDPQVENQRGNMVPALGYLEKYDELLQKAQNQTITTAEVQLLIQCFDQAELHQYEQARELSVALLKEWLVKYKFKNWKTTETRKLRVNKQMKTECAERIARDLNETKKWHVHGYGISKDVLINDIKVLIDDFGNDAELSAIIRGYHDLLWDYMAKVRTRGVVHFAGNYSPFM
jgi:hypothetical protein